MSEYTVTTPYGALSRVPGDLALALLAVLGDKGVVTLGKLAALPAPRAATVPRSDYRRALEALDAGHEVTLAAPSGTTQRVWLGRLRAAANSIGGRGAFTVRPDGTRAAVVRRSSP